MKAVILAGGKGTRLGEYTHEIPKPMVMIGDKPILGHIIDIYCNQGFYDFIIAGGYKREIIDEWLTTEYGTRSPLKIRLVDTGAKTMTGGRLKRINKHIPAGPFMMTYGDGVADVDLVHLQTFHRSMGSLVTLTAVRPPARFGSLRLDGSGKVVGFHEKSQVMEGWVNGGFMIIEKEVLDMIEGDETNFERDILPEIASMGRLHAYFHTGFWQCMDTARDVELLRQLYKDGGPWITKT